MMELQTWHLNSHYNMDFMDRLEEWAHRGYSFQRIASLSGLGEVELRKLIDRNGIWVRG